MKEKYGWKAKILPGKKEEYVKRHNNIWPELVKLLKEAGIANYSIWIVDNDVFGYYECEKGIEYAAKMQAGSEIVDKWNEYMKDVMDMTLGDNGAQPLMEKVFDLQ